MTRNEMLEALEEIIKPCNSTYRTSREKAAVRILAEVEKHMIPNSLNGTLTYTAQNRWENEDE